MSCARRGILAMIALSAAPALPAGGQTVTVNVSTFRNANGALECSLFAGPKGFPDHPEAAIAKVRSAIGADHTAACVFRGLAPGEYAVGVMHDEDGNGKFDQGLFGMPLEGYGFSNNHTHALSAPTWEESR